MTPTPKARRTAARISRAAGDLFAEHGYDATTIADVAAASGVASGTVLLHFGSKSALATAAFADRIGAVVEGIGRELAGDDVFADLDLVVTTLFTWYAEVGAVGAELLRESLFSTGPWAEHYNEVVQATVARFTAIVRHHQATGAVSGDIDADLAGQGCLADYLLVLIQGLRGIHGGVGAQSAAFERLARQRLHAPR